MAEEPRRSGRATKGQHKNLDMEPPPPKRRGKAQEKSTKRSSTERTPPASNEDEEIIRCICGEYEEEEDVERDMICCDKCAAWQHNDCMGLYFPKGQEPAEYYCEKCKPANHKDLLEKINRGERPWEEAALQRAQRAEEKKSRKKKGGKRGKKGRQSDARSETNDVSATPEKETESPTPTQRNVIVAVPPFNEPSSSQKRKYEEHGTEPQGHHEPGPKQKLQRLSTGGMPVSPHEAKGSPGLSRKSSVVSSSSPAQERPGVSPTTPGGATNVLTAAREKVVKALSTVFTDTATAAQRKGTFIPPAGETSKDVGERLAVAIEEALCRNLCGSSGEPNEAYGRQMRGILYNVKKNAVLGDSVLLGNTSPDALATMSSQDMASEELKRKDEEIKREAERQHIIVQEEGPRIRRTHKGEELVEADPQIVGTESIFSTAPARRDTATTEGEIHSAASPQHASPTTSQRPEFPDTSQRRSAEDSAVADTNRRSSSNFNIENVWSSVQSPGAGHHHDQHFGPAGSFREPAPSGNKVQDDAEIDMLLKDEEDIESPPYSPKDFHGGDIWRGVISMSSVAEFRATASHVGGADLSGKIPWSQLVPRTIPIVGRINTELATDYLCGLRYSYSTDIVVVAVHPPDAEADAAQFNLLFDYFMQRNRYGVGGKHPLPVVKDTYLIPVDSGHSKKPEFIELLENNMVEDPTPTRLLLVVFVVKTNNSSSTPSHPTPQAPTASAASPAQNQPAVDTKPGGRANIPQTDGASADSYVPPPSISPQGLTGTAAAEQVLGPLAHSPAVKELVARAPNASAEQLGVIRGILAQNPAAGADYQLLMEALLKATNGM
ncbi:hypothetical protein FQN57_001620 [Myotisia sp. PD_48]|nr:hypothetical protein FQN57_001620 [Myotisia sp. PD_48]